MRPNLFITPENIPVLSFFFKKDCRKANTDNSIIAMSEVVQIQKDLDAPVSAYTVYSDSSYDVAVPLIIALAVL